MATEILPAASGAANSSDITVAAGATLTVSLKGYGGDAEVQILLKDDAAAYNMVGGLDSKQPSAVITGAGVYRFTRPARSGACGVFYG